MFNLKNREKKKTDNNQFFCYQHFRKRITQKIKTKNVPNFIKDLNL